MELIWLLFISEAATTDVNLKEHADLEDGLRMAPNLVPCSGNANQLI